MKRIELILAVVLFLPLQVFPQYVDIPDTAFFYALIEEGVDTNEDSLISFSEADTVNELVIMGRGITDMTGIEAFINLEALGCDGSDFKHIDLSNNTKLRYLCIYESIGKGCLVPSPMGKLESLDVSDLNYLTTLVCRHQPVTFLDISNNIAIKNLDIGYNWELNEVCVWTLPFPPDDVKVYSFNSNVTYTTDCSN